MMPILITGCHGLLGQKLVELFGQEFGELHGVDLHKENLFKGLAGFHYHRHNLAERAATLELVKRVQPRAIINTAAMTQVDACEAERDTCWRINVDAVCTLVKAARRTRARLIHLSTDYVFNGDSGPYSELDRPNPISFYGKSKHASENEVLGGGIEGTIVRTVVLFGHGRNLKPSFVSWLVSKLREGVEVKIVTDQISNVTLVDDLAGAIKRVLSLGKTGIYHVAGREIISRYDFARRISEAYGLNSSSIRPTLTRLLEQAAPRPLQGGLVVDKAQKELNLSFSNVDGAIRKYREQEAQLN